MSISFYLRCKATKQAVHIAEQSSRWFRGADYPSVLGAFAVAHGGQELDVIDGDHFDDFMEYEVWVPANAGVRFAAMVGRPCAGLDVA